MKYILIDILPDKIMGTVTFRKNGILMESKGLQ